MSPFFFFFLNSRPQNTHLVTISRFTEGMLSAQTCSTSRNEPSTPQSSCTPCHRCSRYSGRLGKEWAGPGEAGAEPGRGSSGPASACAPLKPPFAQQPISAQRGPPPASPLAGCHVQGSLPLEVSVHPPRKRGPRPLPSAPAPRNRPQRTAR